MGKFFADDGDGDADAGQDGLGEGGADGQTVDEVVESVAEDDHPGDGGDVRSSSGSGREIVRVTVMPVVIRVLVTDDAAAVGSGSVRFDVNDHVVRSNFAP